jgi:hypothetical protein
MIHGQGFDLEFWAKAVNTMIYIKNRWPTKAFDSKTLQETCTCRKLDVYHLRIFGYKMYVHIPDGKKSRLESLPRVF